MALDAREKKLLLIPVGLAAVLAFYNWVHEPLFARRAEAAEKSQQVSADLTREQSRLAKEGNLRSRKDAVAAREQVIDAWVPGKNSAALFIWYLSQAEQHSGARIRGLTVGERKTVTAQAQNGQGAQPQQQGGAQDGSQPNANTPGAGPGAPAPTVTVIRLELKVDARYAQHLLFNQELEQMPLFLSADSIAMARDGALPTAEADKLIQKGKAPLAAQLLSASPNLNGVYQINLFFKDEKAGPTTDPMQFTTAAGKPDPFVADGVDQFVKLLSDYYSGAGGSGSFPGGDGLINPDSNGGHREQMG